MAEARARDVVFIGARFVVAETGEARLIFGGRPRGDFAAGEDGWAAGMGAAGFATGMKGTGMPPEGRATGMTGPGVETFTAFATGFTGAGLATGFAGANEDAGATISFAAGVFTDGIDVMTGFAGAGVAGFTTMRVGAPAGLAVAGAGALATGTAGFATGATAGLVPPGDDIPAAACLSFSTEDAVFFETPVGGTNGKAGFAGADVAFTGFAFFATGGAGAGLPPAADFFEAGVTIFLVDFLPEGVLAIRAGNLPRREVR
jgi:hypothetical protein